METKSAKNLNLLIAFVRGGNIKALLAGIEKDDDDCKRWRRGGGGDGNTSNLASSSQGSGRVGLACLAGTSISPGASSTGKLVKALSAMANLVVGKCARILNLSAEELQMQYDQEASCSGKDPSYARNLLEYCCFRALGVAKEAMDVLKDKEFRRLTFDMMLAWETPGAGHRPAEKVDAESTVSIESYARIAPHVSIAADSITVHSQFEVLTSETRGRLRFAVHDKYMQELDKSIKQIKSHATPAVRTALGFTAGEENVVEIDGTTTAPVLQRVGIRAWPGRLTLTDHALYFESYNVVYYGKAKKFDLTVDTRHKVKPDFTGPWGARLFDKAVAYSTNLMAEPIGFEFPELKSHSRRDYWLVIIREVVAVHSFIRSQKLEGSVREQALAKCVQGILRLKAIWAVLKVFPPRVQRLLTFLAADELPGGDRILEVLAETLRSAAVAASSSPPLSPSPYGQTVGPSDKALDGEMESPREANSNRCDAGRGDGNSVDAGRSGGNGAGNGTGMNKGTEGIAGSSRIRRLGTAIEKSLAVAAEVALRPGSAAPRTGVGGYHGEDRVAKVKVGEVMIGEMNALESAVAASLDNSKKVEKAKASVNEAKVEGIGTNKALLEELLAPLLALLGWVHSLAEWREPSKSLTFLLAVLYIIYKDWLKFVIPTLLVANAGLILCLRHLRRFDWMSGGSRNNEVVVLLPKGQSKVAQLLELQNGVAYLGRVIQAANIFLLKTRALFLSEVRQATDMVVFFHIVAAILLLVIPFRLLVLLMVLEIFSRKLEFRKEAIRRWTRRMRDWWHSIPVVPVRFVDATSKTKTTE